MTQIFTRKQLKVWKSLKSHIPKQTNSNMKEHFVCISQMHKWNEKTPVERMELMIEKIIQLYPALLFSFNVFLINFCT
jgi:hypothetical protein